MTCRTTLNIMDLGVRQGLSYRSLVWQAENMTTQKNEYGFPVSPAFEQSKTALERWNMQRSDERCQGVSVPSVIDFYGLAVGRPSLVRAHPGRSKCSYSTIAIH
jgi:hypothetical protein